jgi:hypothetical protein
MSERITLRVTMELVSDAVFGSGFSVPGGEDIAVCTDGDGLPCLKGSTFKGLLRESLENWLCWTGGTAETLNALMGESGRNGTDDGRRVHLTALTAELRDPEACFSPPWRTAQRRRAPCGWPAACAAACASPARWSAWQRTGS